MDIDRALGRFTAVMGSRHPSWYAQLRPGLADAGIDRLRRAVSPYLVPRQVEALYRWHDGGDSGVFGGWHMHPLDELIPSYEFTCAELRSPRTWLPVFDDQIVTVVTLDLPGLPPSDPSVWYGHTHDVTLDRLFDSIAAVLDVVCDAAEAGALADVDGCFGLLDGGRPESLDGGGWTRYRLARCPSAYRYPDPPAGTSVERSPDPDWPGAWLVPLGVTDESLALRGPTATVAGLLDAAAGGPVEATIRGRVVAGSFVGDVWYPVVEDETGSIVVECDTRLLPFTIGVGRHGEFDVLTGSAATARALATRPVPTTGRRRAPRQEP